jgi:hypothetical protein
MTTPYASEAKIKAQAEYVCWRDGNVADTATDKADVSRNSNVVLLDHRAGASQ